MRDREVRLSRQPHKLEIAGSNPAPATECKNTRIGVKMSFKIVTEDGDVHDTSKQWEVVGLLPFLFVVYVVIEHVIGFWN